MGRKLDLSGLSDNEAEHVLQVVQRDMKLRKKEEERLSELKQELDEEGSRCVLLSRQGFFNQRCCIRCCSPFTFLLNPKRKCHDCRYNVCKACRVYCKREKAWLCSSCEKSRLLKTQNLEWFYTNVKTRFKRFGSAKVLKTLYRKHLVEHSTLSELTEGSGYEESICNEGSICGSDSAFYRQSEEHSMEETLTVALRVAEEAIDEAITKAEFDTSSQEKQNEAHYLREHKGELVEELAKTIVQKIINRRKTLADMRADYVQDWPVDHNSDLHRHHQSASATSSVKQQPGLFRSHSAYSLLENDSPGLVQDPSKASVKEGGGSAMTAWKSVDRLDNAGVSAVLHSMDGNWIALQSAQLSRPSLLTKRKSQVYSALERESVVVSAYEGMGSDNDIKHESDGSLGAALQEIHRKMMDSNINLQDTCDRILSPLMKRRGSGDKILSPMMGRRGSRDSLLSDSEGNWKPSKPLLGVIKMKVPAEIRRPTSRRTSIIDINFNVEGTRQEESIGAAELEAQRVESSQMKTKSEKESSTLDNSRTDNNLSGAVTPDILSSGGMVTPDPLELENSIRGQVDNEVDQELTSKLEKLEQLTSRVDESSAGDEREVVDGVKDAVNDGQREGDEERNEDGDEEDEQPQRMEIESDEGRTEDDEKEEDEGNEEDKDMNYRLNQLITQSRLNYFSSTDDELDKVGKSEEEDEGEGDKDEGMEEEQNEQREEHSNGFTYKLCQLEKEARANQFSSTEDEMDRVGVEEKAAGEEEDGGKDVELAVKVCRLAYQTNANQFSSTEDELDSVGLLDDDINAGEEADGKKEELALKVCRLAHQVNASQFSSTEDELDRVGIGEEEEEGVDEEALWKVQAERAVQAAQQRDLASLVGASEFSSTEDNLDKVGETEEKVNHQDKEESFEDLDVNMFDLRDEIEKKKGSEQVAPEARREEGEVLKDGEADKGLKMEVNTVAEGEKTKETVEVEQKNQPEAKKQEDDKVEESSGSQASWETADEERSEEYAEFDRIISSMLMMTLEDMEGHAERDETDESVEVVKKPEQAENVKTEEESKQVKVDEEVNLGKEREVEHVEVKEEVRIVEESGSQHVEVVVEVEVGGESELEHVEVEEEVKTRKESEESVEVVEEVKVEEESELKQEEVAEKAGAEGEVKDETLDTQSSDKKETESKNEVQSPSENVLVKDKPEDNMQKKEEKGDAPVIKEKELQKKETNPQVLKSLEKKSTVMSIKEMLETYEAKQLCKRIGLHEDKQEDRGGKVSAVRQLMETQGDISEAKEWTEEMKERKALNEGQSRRSSLDVLQKPEEAQVQHEEKQEDKGGIVSAMRQMMEAHGEAAERMEETKVKKEYNKAQNRRSSLDILQTPDETPVQQEDKQEDRVGKVLAVRQMIEAHGEVTEAKEREAKERMEESKGRKVYNKAQSRRSSLDILQTPEDTQMQHEDKQEDKGGKVSAVRQMMEAHGDIAERIEEIKGKKVYSKVQSRRSSLDSLLTPEEIQTHENKQEDRGGKVSAVRQMIEGHGDVSEKAEDSKGKKPYSKAQSRRSSLDVLQTPEEIQMNSEMEIYETLELISTLLEQRYSAVQLRSITTEVLKVLNTTEDLLQGVQGEERRLPSIPSLPPNTDPKKLDQQFSKLEETVYVAAGSIYSLEAELSDLEECARSISGTTSDMELSFLEEQVASAAAKVQQSDLQICDISARIAALKNAGLNVDTQSRPPKTRTIPVMPVTLDSSRQHRRRLPAPPMKDKET